METTAPLRRLCKALCGVCLALLCVNFVPLEGKDSINLPLCAALCMSPLVLVLPQARVILPRLDLPLALVCACVIGMPLIFHPSTARWSTMLFTCAYCFFFMMLARLVRIAEITPAELLRFIRVLVYAYCAGLLVQQIFVVAGMTAPYQGELSQWYPAWKLNSLSAEPSHSTVILCTAMYFYTQTVRTVTPSLSLWRCIADHKWVWICFGWTMVTVPVASTMVFVPLCFLPYLTRRNALPVAGVVVIALIALFFTPVGDLPQPSRLRDFMKASATLDEETIIIEADESASSHILPTIWGAKGVADTPYDFLTGHGADAALRQLPQIPGALRRGGSAGIFNMCYNYGVVCALCFLAAIFIVTAIRKKPLSFLTFLLAIFLSADYNVQLVWQLLAFSMIYKYAVCRDRAFLSPLR